MITLYLIGLMKLELPTRTVRLCDGGFQSWGAETFTSKDDVFGIIGSIDGLETGVSDTIPSFELTLFPAGETEPATLVQPGFQGSRARFWIAEYNATTGAIVGTPTLEFDGQLNRAKVTVGRAQRSITMGITPLCERMLALNIGNSMSPNWHKSIWSGETGHDQATGLMRQDAWGTESPSAPSLTATYGGYVSPYAQARGIL